MAKDKNQTQEPTKRRRGTTISGTSSQQPPNPPLYQRFVSEIAEERFNVIKKRVFNKERGISMDKLARHPSFVWLIQARKWDGIVNMVTKESNASIALEFLANAFHKKGVFAYVRGKRVECNNRSIMRILGLRDIENCDVKHHKQGYDNFRTRAEWDRLLVGLMRDGKVWIGPVDRPQRINTADFLPEYKAWASFILTVIEQTSSTAEMIRDRVIILLAIISDKDIGVAELMADSLWKLVRTDKNTLGHCCLINKLCQEAHVPVEPIDVYVKSLRFISDSVHPSQMQQQGFPPYFAEYTYAMANWAQDVSSRDWMPPLSFRQLFYEAAERYPQSSLARTNAFDRFASPLDMENYFAEERLRGANAEERIRAGIVYFKMQFIIFQEGIFDGKSLGAKERDLEQIGHKNMKIGKQNIFPTSQKLGTARASLGTAVPPSRCLLLLLL
ncbi:hypothetical protein MTR_6g463930 [Medicago truncatula]|uniref:Putative plant transposon protein domain-containing protein n=1 Tax=Medicago truncatula TaxID=3880 RepID=A0A072UA57_MEDTR|nr:hypothetical protein MTR_6g463930 [Medicago truncatula]